MNDENWIRELTKITLEQQEEEESQLGERWDRLSSGELSPEEEAELLALAETSEEGREAYEAFRPLGPEFQASVVRAIRGVPPPKKRTLWDFLADLWKALANLLPLPRRAQFAGLGAAAVVAAAVVVPFLRPPPLPVYATLTIHGDQAVRGEESAAAGDIVLAPGDRFQGQLQLATSSRAKNLEAQYFLIRGQDLRRLDVGSTIDPGGAVKMKGTLGRDLAPGAWVLWAVVGRQGKLPDPADLKRFSASSPIRQRDWVAMPKRVRIQPREPPT